MTKMPPNKTSLPSHGKRHSLIAVSNVDQVFNDVVIEELGAILKLKTLEGDDFRRFAQSVRHDIRGNVPIDVEVGGQALPALSR